MQRSDFGNPWLSNIHEVAPPEAVSLIPNAPGFWLLTVIAAAAMALASFGFWQNWRAKAYRREGQRILSDWQRQLNQGGLSAADKRRIPELVRRVAIGTWGRKQVVAMRGQAWIDFLQCSLPRRGDNRRKPVVARSGVPAGRSARRR